MVNINVFGQILHLIVSTLLNNLVAEHDSDKHVKGINSCTHLVSILFCHLSSADSVCDISNGLRSTTGNMSHLGNSTRIKVLFIFSEDLHNLRMIFHWSSQRLC